MVELCVQRACDDVPDHMPADAQDTALYNSTHHLPVDPREHQELLCVLDLDECLLHSKFHCSEAAAKSYRQEEYRPETINSVDSFVLELPDGFVQCNKRPGLDAFLEALARMAKVVVFTAAMPDYAGPVLDVLDPTGKLFHRRLYRSSCRQVRGAFLKDLTVLGNGFEANPGRVILLDNNPCSFLCQPTNGILITSFYDDAQDTALASVLQLVQHLDKCADVRPILRDMFRLETLLREYSHALFGDSAVHSGSDSSSSSSDMVVAATADSSSSSSAEDQQLLSDDEFEHLSAAAAVTAAAADADDCCCEDEDADYADLDDEELSVQSSECQDEASSSMDIQ